MKRALILIVALGALFATAVTSLAQNGGTFALTSFTIDGGGGNSSGGSYTLGGTVGQADAGSMNGGSFALNGGYWAVSLATGTSRTATPTATRTKTPTGGNTPTVTPTRTRTPSVTPTSGDCTTRPAKPILVKPGNSKKAKGLAVALDWQDAPCAITYDVLVRTGTKNGAKAFSKKNLTISQATTKALVKGQTYFWQVTAKNSIGKTKSDWWSFTVK